MCGDDTCAFGENSLNCPQDCGYPAGASCGNNDDCASYICWTLAQQLFFQVPPDKLRDPGIRLPCLPGSNTCGPGKVCDGLQFSECRDLAPRGTYCVLPYVCASNKCQFDLLWGGPRCADCTASGQCPSGQWAGRDAPWQRVGAAPVRGLAGHQQGAAGRRLVRRVGALRRAHRGLLVAAFLLQHYPQVIARIRTRSGSAEVATDPMGVEVSEVFVMLTPAAAWLHDGPGGFASQEALVDDMSRRLGQLPGMRAAFTQPIEMRVNERVAGIRADLGLVPYGDDFKVLGEKARAIEVLKTLPGAADVSTEQLTGQPVIEVVLDPLALGLLVSAIRRRLADGDAVVVAVQEAAATRLRPVLMTRWSRVSGQCRWPWRRGSGPKCSGRSRRWSSVGSSRRRS